MMVNFGSHMNIAYQKDDLNTHSLFIVSALIVN